MPLSVPVPASETAAAVWAYATRLLTAAQAAALAEITAARLAELDAGNMPGDINTLLLREIALSFPSAEALDAIAAIGPTNTTERTITVSLPTGATIRRVILAAFITVMNNSTNAQKLDIDVQGRVAGGSWNTYFSEDGVAGFPATDGATTGLVPLSDVTTLVTAEGTYGFRLAVTQTSANSVRYTTQYVLIVTYRTG